RLSRRMIALRKRSRKSTSSAADDLCPTTPTTATASATAVPTLHGRFLSEGLLARHRWRDDGTQRRYQCLRALVLRSYRAQSRTVNPTPLLVASFSARLWRLGNRAKCQWFPVWRGIHPPERTRERRDRACLPYSGTQAISRSS